MFVILVLLTAYFQSPRLALVSIGAVPGVFSGIATILYFTNTSLNIESFMGSIMCLGVSVSNSVMLVTFMNDHWKGGAPSTEAAVVGASDRLRPILMTACAMTIGMVPMALALEQGSQMQAPLGRAVIGGLVMSTFATLLLVPSIFALVIGRKVATIAVDLPGRPREPALRPAARHEPRERGRPRRHPALVESRRQRREPCAPDGAGPKSNPLARRSLMRPPLWPPVPDRPAGRRWLVFGLLAALAVAGCGGEPKAATTSVSEPPDGPPDPPGVRTIVRVVGQPASSRPMSTRRSIPS